ncbi:hypothetical protein GGI20_005232 [Coemansia sp. BCRC 34301]|nr:hypothetical protein GGI20_005232 [Coemansia sp. BCRC 34301]
MRFFTLIALSGLLAAAALVSAEEAAEEPGNYVVVVNRNYKKTKIVYDDPDAGECITVKKVFDDEDTDIYTVGRPVKLYSDKYCSEEFKTTEANDPKDKKPSHVRHALRSFMVQKVDDE